MKERGLSPMELRYEYEIRKVYYSTESGARMSLGSVTLRGATTIDAYYFVYILL